MNEAAAAVPLELHAPIPETCKPPLIKEMADALDLVAPGYAWAWHDAQRTEAQRRYILPGKTNDAAGNWRHRNRKRLRYGFDRCLPIYGYWTETPRVLTFFNRGYVPVVRTTHEDQPIPEIARLWHDAGGLEANGLSQSELDRQERRDRNRFFYLRQRLSNHPGHGDLSQDKWFSHDGTPYGWRCRFTIALCRYLARSAAEPEALWQDEDLTRSS